MVVGTESTETLRAFALGRAATGSAVDSSSDALLGVGASLRSRLRAFALGLAAGVRDLCRPRVVGGGVPMSYVGTAVGIVGTGIGSGVGGGAGGGSGGPVLYVTLIGLGSRFFPGFLTFTAPAPGGGGGGPPPVYCTISLGALGGGRRWITAGFCSRIKCV